MRGSCAGGAAKAIATKLAEPSGLLVDDTDIYFVANGDLFRVPKEGGSVESVVKGIYGAPSSVAGTHIYYFAPDPEHYSGDLTLMRIAKSGARPEAIVKVARPSRAIDEPEVRWNSEVVIWIDRGTLHRQAIQKGAPQALGNATRLQLHGDWVYWANQDGCRRHSRKECPQPSSVHEDRLN